MRSKGRRVVVATLNQLYADEIRDEFLPFSYGARRIHAAVVSPPIAGVEASLLEFTARDPEAVADAIAALAPDVVGFSTYLWSFPTFCEAVRILRQRLPGCTFVFGGPSARAAMVDHPAYSWVREFVDALVVREGEQIIRAVVQAEDRSREGLATIPGLVIPRGVGVDTGWISTPAPVLLPMDDIPSPHQLGLVPDGITANLETFRGCPLACSFCEWGVFEGTNRVFSEAYLVRELEAFKRSHATGACLVDAGINLNRRAFRNLAAAEKQVGFLAEQSLSCEVYASNLNEDDAAFLGSVNVGRIGVGLQSFNPDVLRLMQRPFDEKRFLRGLSMLRQVCGGVAIEIILGLPGDNPESFKRTVAKAMDLGAGNVHVFHALVLPDGLMTRAPEGSDVRFDPLTLKMTSCSSWSERDLGDTIEWMSRFTESSGGVSEVSFWRVPLANARTDASRMLSVPEVFLTKRAPATPTFARASEAEKLQKRDGAPDAPQEAPSASIDGVLLHAFAESTIERTQGRWRAIDVKQRPRALAVRLIAPEGEIELDVVEHDPSRPSLQAIDGWAVSYRPPRFAIAKEDVERIRQLAPTLAALATASLGAGAGSGAEASGEKPKRMLPMEPNR